MKVVRKEFPDGKKCPACWWKVQFHYSFDCNPIHEEGMCADCFLDMIVEGKREVGPSQEEVKP